MSFNQISLEGNLFSQAFKAYVEGDIDTYTKLLPILSYQFPEIQRVLRSQTISELIDFLKRAKQMVSVLPDPNNLVPAKLNNINSFLGKAYLEEWERNYKLVSQLNAEGERLYDKEKYDSAIIVFEKSLAIMPTEHAHVHLANIYLIKKQPQLFRNHIKMAASFGRDDSLLKLYSTMFKKILNKPANLNELYLCGKVMIQFGIQDKSVYFEYIREAARRREKIDEKVMLDFPESFQKTMCKGILLESQKAVQYFLRVQKQIIDKIGYPNSQKHKQSSESYYSDKIDLFYLYLSRICTNSFAYYDDRNYYLQKGLNYKPDSYQLLKQFLLLIAYDPILAYPTAEQLKLIQQLGNSQQKNKGPNQQRIFDYQMIEIVYELFAEIQPQSSVLTLVMEGVQEYSKYHQIYLLAAKIHLRYGQLLKAREYCEEGLKMRPNSAEGQVIMGNIEYKNKQYHKAKSCYQKSLQIDKNNFPALYCLAALYYSLKKYQPCIAMLQQAKKVEPTGTQMKRLYQLIVKAYFRLNEYDKAAVEVQELVATAKIKSISGEISYSFAEVKFNKNLFEDAIKFYQAAIDVYPKHFQSRYKLILTQLILNPNVNEVQLRQMMETIKKLIKQQKTDTQCLTLYGYLLSKSSRIKEAVEVFYQCITRNEQSCYAYYHLARLFKEHKGSIAEKVMNELGQRIKKIGTPTSFYANIFAFMAAESHEELLYNFDQLFKYYKDKIKTSQKHKEQFLKLYERLIGSFLYLNALYPDSDGLLLFTSILYRGKNEHKQVQKYIIKLLSKYSKKNQPLFDVLFQFYNKNHKQCHKLNYFTFILEFIFEELLEHHPWELMKFRDRLGEGLEMFRENRVVNACIVKYLSGIAEIVKKFKKMSEEFKEQMNLMNDQKEAKNSADQLFYKLIQAQLRPRRAYSNYNNIDTSLLPEGQGQLKKSAAMQMLANQMKIYIDQFKQATVDKIEQLLVAIPNLVLVTFAFTSLSPFVYFEQHKQSKDKQLLSNLAQTIKKLLNVRSIELIQAKLSEFIKILIGHYSFHQLSLEQQPPTLPNSLFSNLNNELQSIICSSQKTLNSTTFSLQHRKPISNCKQFDYEARKPYTNKAKLPFNSSIIYVTSQIIIKPPSSAVSSINQGGDQYNEQDFK